MMKQNKTPRDEVQFQVVGSQGLVSGSPPVGLYFQKMTPMEKSLKDEKLYIFVEMATLLSLHTPLPHPVQAMHADHMTVPEAPKGFHISRK